MIPKGEIIRETYFNEQGILQYIVTIKIGVSNSFQLYKVEDGKETKIDKADSPNEFKDKIVFWKVK